MAFDEQLAARARKVLQAYKGIAELRMFGGVAFKLGDNMFGGIVGHELIVRLGTRVTVDDPHLRPMNFTGKPLKGIFYVSTAGVVTDDRLRYWFDRAIAFVAQLPVKCQRHV